MELPQKIIDKLSERKKVNAFREVGDDSKNIDFLSNDYLGLSKSKTVFYLSHAYLVENGYEVNGATGSRLLSGNHFLYQEVEKMLCQFHSSESALIFNSGYDANVGFFSSVPQRGDIILYDEFIHASIRDGISLSHAKSYKFKHNDLENLETLFKRIKETNASVYIATESVFSMDGSKAILEELALFSSSNNCYLIVDEAHAVGVFGKDGSGLVQELGLEKLIFARIITFGKAIGAHGAAILGDDLLKKYLINFARSFIYTTALPPHALATILFAYQEIKAQNKSSTLLKKIHFFKSEVKRLKLEKNFLESDSSIQSIIVRGNDNVKKVAVKIQMSGFDVKPILSPTVAAGQERLRFCIHTYNSEKEISKILELLINFTPQ